MTADSCSFIMVFQTGHECYFGIWILRFDRWKTRIEWGPLENKIEKLPHSFKSGKLGGQDFSAQASDYFQFQKYRLKYQNFEATNKSWLPVNWNELHG